MDYMARQDLTRLFAKYAGSCEERWEFTKNHELIHNERGRTTVVGIRKRENTIFLQLDFHNTRAREQRLRRNEHLSSDNTYLELPSEARKELQKWIAIKVMNPKVMAGYSLPTMTESDIQLVGMWYQPIRNNLGSQSIIEN